MVLLVTLATLWASSYSFIKLGVATIPPITLITGRTLIAGAFLLVLIRLRGLSLPRDLATWKKFLIQAVLNSVIPFTLIAWGQQTVDASLASILNSTSPIFTFLITWGVTRHEAVNGRKLFGVAAGLLGIGLIVGLSALSGFGDQLLPQLAITFASVCYAGAAIFGTRFAKTDPMVTAAGSLLAGAIILVPACILIDRPWTLAPSSTSLLALLALSLFSTALGFIIYFHLVRTIGSVSTTAQAYIRVPIGVLIGVVFLGETLPPQAWLGLVLVVAGVAAMTIPGRKGRQRAAVPPPPPV
jgi:drug/metabolite transporter (DMT)-like permease